MDEFSIYFLIIHSCGFSKKIVLNSKVFVFSSRRLIKRSWMQAEWIKAESVHSMEPVEVVQMKYCGDSTLKTGMRSKGVDFSVWLQRYQWNAMFTFGSATLFWTHRN